MHLKPMGRLVLTVVVGVVVGAVGTLLSSTSRRSQTEKTLKWEALEGEEGSDLQRTPTPEGWIVENTDGYLLHVPDSEHKWLAEQDDE